MKLKILRSVLEANDQIAARVRERLTAHGITTINLISAPGAGKTTLLERTIPRLQPRRVAVLEGDIATTRDAERIEKLGVPVVQLLTGGACHLEAPLIERGLSELELAGLDLLFIENVGNIACPAEFDLGETCKVGILSVTEGHDKPGKYPLLFHEIRALVLNKTDLTAHTDFDYVTFLADFRKLNATAPVFPVSCRTGDGLEQWTHWLEHVLAGELDAASHTHPHAHSHEHAHEHGHDHDHGRLPVIEGLQPHAHPHRTTHQGVIAS